MLRARVIWAAWKQVDRVPFVHGKVANSLDFLNLNADFVKNIGHAHLCITANTEHSLFTLWLDINVKYRMQILANMHQFDCALHSMCQL